MGHDLPGIMEELAQTKHKLIQKTASQERQLTRMSAELTEAKTLQLVIDRNLQELRTEVQMQHVVPVTIKMAGFGECKKKSTAWFSRPFYTGRGGCKMCLRVDANGSEDSRGTHVSVGAYLMRGEFDSRLKWPYRGTVTIQLVNQLEDKEHCTKTIRYTEAADRDCSISSQVTDGEQASAGCGWSRFIRHSNLGLSVANNRQYLKDDCLFFHIQ